MPSPALWWTLRQFASTGARLFGRSRTISGTTSRSAPWFARSFTNTRLTLPAWRNLAWSRRYFPGYRRLVGPGRILDRHVWERIRIPAYTLPGITGQLVPVEGPDWRDVEFYIPGAPAQSNFRLAFAPPRAYGYYQGMGAPVPNYEMLVTLLPGTRYAQGGNRIPPEENRRRMDSKVPGFYNRALAFINKYYGRPEEWLDFMVAVHAGNGNLLATLSNLAYNEAIDYSYGAKARYLKRHVYSQDYYRLPVGLDTLSRLFPY